MALSDIFRRGRKAENSAVNRRPRVITDGGYNSIALRIGSKKYADAYLWMIFNKIFAGLQNVHYYSDIEGEGKDLFQNIAQTLDNNIKTIVWSWWVNGFVVIEKDHRNKGRFFFPDIKGLKDRDGNLRIRRGQIVIYSDAYIYGGLSDFQILANDICILDTFKNGLEYLTRSMGALGLMSSKAMPIPQADKDEFNKELKEKYGIREDQFQILLFDTPVDFQQMTLPIKDLQLDERIKDEIKILAGYFNVPYDLLPVSGQSTYANQEQAIRQFYANCISPLAEVGLSLGRQIIKEERGVLRLSDNLTFRIENVPELEDDRTASIEYKLKLVELVERMSALGLVTEKYDEQLENIE